MHKVDQVDVRAGDLTRWKSIGQVAEAIMWGISKGCATPQEGAGSPIPLRPPTCGPVPCTQTAGGESA